MNDFQNIVNIFIIQFKNPDRIGLTQFETISFQGLKQKIRQRERFGYLTKVEITEIFQDYLKLNDSHLKRIFKFFDDIIPGVPPSSYAEMAKWQLPQFVVNREQEDERYTFMLATCIQPEEVIKE